MNTNRKISLDIIQYLEGSLSGKDIIRIEEWINESPDHRKYFDEVRISWELSLNSDPARDAMAEAAWQRLNKMIHQKNNSGVGGRIKQFFNDGKGRNTLWRIAAAISGFVLLASIVLIIINNIRFWEGDMLTVKTNDRLQEVILPDNSRITLNKNSILRYPEKFNRADRRIYLQGLAFVEVSPDPGKAFRIEAGKGIITVLGTAFLVDAPGNDEIVRVIVEHGKVALGMKEESEFAKVVLTEGEQGKLNKETGSIRKMANNDVNYLSWKTKTFEFRNTPLREVFAVINKAYAEQLEFDDERMNELILTAQYKNEDLADIAQILSLTFSINYTYKEGVYLFEFDD